MKANGPEHVVAKYARIFSYEVLGVLLLGGSGHTVRWLKDGPWNEES